jgi:ketosteroid isomerase-like protein
VSQNADTIRQLIDARNAFVRGELSSEAVAARFDPQIEMIWRDRQTYPDFPQRLRGAAEVIAFAAQLRDAWIDRIQELLELIEAPDGRAVALVRQSGRGRQSGVPVVIHFFELFTIRDGKVLKIEFFRHRADALQAAGLGELAVSPNLDLVRSIYADWERGDYSSANWADPEIEWTAVGGPEPSSGTGVATLDVAWRDFLEAWGEYRQVAEAFRALDIHRVLVLIRVRARGRASGLIAEGGTKAATVVRIRDGKVTKLDIYWDRDRALADLGLEE